MLLSNRNNRAAASGRSFLLRAGLATIGSTLLASSAQAALVGVCTGVSLPKSVITNILAGPLNGIATPVQGTVNTLLSALTGLPVIGGVLNPLLPAPLSINVTGLLATAASGGPITLQALATDGTVVGPADNCQATADSYTLDTPAGISIGGNSITGLGTGNAASAGSLGAIALGNNASTTVAATNSVALGTNASATAANSVALGAGSTATRGAQIGYAAPGLSTPQTSAGEVSVGAPGAERQITNVAAGSAPTDAVNVSQVAAAITASAAAGPVQYSNPGTPTTPNGGVPTNDVTLVGAAAGPVTVHNVAPGALAAGSTDAVNGGQLFTTNQNVTTNTTNIAGNTTAIAGNTTAIAGNTTSITNLNNGTAGIVRQVGGAPGAGTITVGAQTAGTLVDFTGTGGTRTLTGVTAATLGAASTDAVNGSQLFATNTNVTNNAAATTNLTTNINNGTIGLVQQTGGAPGAGQITVGAATGGTSLSVAGTDGTRVVSGVSAGVAATDAVNVSQLAAVGAGAANAVLYDVVGGVRQNSITLAGGAPGPVEINNLADGTIAAGSTDAVNGGQLFTTNQNVATNTTNIATNTSNIATNTTNLGNLTTNINNGTVGLLQQVGGAPGAGTLTVGAATAGTLVDFTGTGGTRTLTGVTAGTVDAASTDAVNGSQLFATNTNVTNNATATTNLTTNINNGTIGLVQQVGGSPGAGLLTVGAATGGTVVSFGGTDGNRRLTNVSDGIALSDAATVGQLGTLAGATANAVQYDTVGGVRQNSITLAGGAAGPVSITNLAPGALAAGSTDAVNGGQLFAISTGVGSVTTVLGGTYDPVTGVYTGPTYNTFGGTTATTIQGAFDNYNTTIGSLSSGLLGPVQYSGAPNTLVLVAPGGTGAAPGAAQVLGNVAAGVAATDAVNVSQLSGAVGTATANAVQYDTIGGVRQNTVTLAGGAAGPVTVTNVAAGALNAGSTDAVNGAQLFATNQQVAINTTNIATNTTNIAGNTTAINNLTTNINNGSVGLVQQTGGAPGSGTITVGAATGGTSVNIAGTGGTRVLSGLSDGVLGSDAATVSQLASVTGGALNAVQYDTVGGTRQNSITLTGGTADPVAIRNVAAGTVAAGSTDAVNGGQLAAVTSTVAGNTTTINNVVNGQAGAFRSDNTAGAAASSATGANSSSGGFGASATGARSLALGNSSTASGTNSVALGAGSTDGGVANVVSVGSAGAERRLTNVGPGLNGTDAVNLSQLQSATNTFATTANGLQTQVDGLQGQINQLDFDLGKVKRRANAGTAGALAIAGLPQPFTEGAGMVAGGVGYWQGQVAFAVGVSKIVSEKVIVKAGASISGRGTAGGNAGVGFQF